jgi:hypothetical protein
MAVYSTYVLRSKTERDARRVFAAIQRRWPMMEDRRTVLSAWADGDLQSVMDVAQMALETRLVSHGEREELVGAVLECRSWPECLIVLAEWELMVEDGSLVDLRDAQGMSPGTAETLQAARGEAGQPGPDRDAPVTPCSPEQNQ